MQMKKLTQHLLLLAGGASLTQVAQAKDVLGFEEVIVTAERRSETLQSTPLSIVALGAEQLENIGVTGIEDMQAFVPNLTIIGGNGAGSMVPNFVIRGLGSSAADRVTGDRAVGLYVDDVYFPRTNASLLRILDVERVEVLRGPQGTLFGKNNTGGAIRYISKKPDLEALSGEITASVGEDNIRNLQAIANVPVSDTFALRLQYANLSQDGWVERFGDTIGDTDDEIFRAVGRFQPSEDLTIDAGFTLVDSEANGYALDAVEFFPDTDNAQNSGFNMVRRLNAALVANGESPLVDNDPRIIRDDFSLNSFCLLDNDNDPFTDTGARVELDYGPLGTETTGSGCSMPQESTNQMGFFDVNYNLTDSMSLRLLSGYADVDYDGLQKFYPLGTWGSLNRVESTTYSQEVQLSGVAFDDKFNWVAGGLYSVDDAEQEFVMYWINPFNPANQVVPGFKRRFELETISSGLFAQATLDFTDQLSLTAGLRYSNDEKDFVYRRNNHFLGNPLTGTESWSSTDYRVSLEYEPRDGLMFYATTSTAYRAGGFNDGADDALDLNENGIADPGESNGGILPYEPEEVTSYEIGARTEWANSLRLNATLFYMDYEDIQTATLDQSVAPPVPLIANVGEATIQGLESELVWLVNKNVTINASLGYTDVEMGDFTNPSDGEVLPAAALPGATELSYSLGVVFQDEFSNGAGIKAALNYGFTDELSINIDPNEDYVVPDYGLVNARIDYTLPNENWTVSLLCNNCADETYANGASRFGGFWYGTAEYRGMPRRFQVQAKLEF